MGEGNGLKNKRPWLRLALLAALLAAGLVALRVSGLTAHLTLDNLQALAQEVRGLGWIAPAVYVGLWLAACLFFLPGLPITLLGAVVFGAWWGMLWVVIGSNLGASLAFLASRYAVRPLVESWAGKNPLFNRIDQGVARHGWRMVMITRLVPLFPFNLQNYAYGLTGIGFATYALVSLLCMLPGTAAYCLAGGALVSGQGDIKKTLLYLALGAVCLVLVSLVPGWIKKKVAANDSDLAPNSGR
ncbi:MAG: TVP38/TMEM64 family protein [Desulfarculus sp.]|nr:TVP38/TMEM64 family protein [Desulfarculus sp.]